MNPTIQQLPFEKIDEDLFVPRMVVAIPVQEIAKNCQLTLEKGVDDLDEFDGAILSLDDGSRFTLTHHNGEEPDQTTISLPVEIDKTQAINALLNGIAGALKIEAKAVVWRQQGKNAARKPR